MDRDAIDLHAGEKLGEITAPAIQLLFTNRKLLAQPGGVFTARRSRTGKADHSIIGEMGLDDMPGVIVSGAAHGSVAKLCRAVETNGKSKRALIFQRQFAYGVLSGTVEPQIVFRNIDDGVIENRNGGRCGSNGAKGAGTHKSEPGVNSGGTQQRDHQTGFVFAIAKTASIRLRDWIWFVAIDPEFLGNIVGAAQHKLLDGGDFLSVVMFPLEKSREFGLESLVQRKLRAHEADIPGAELLPVRERGDV